MNISVPDDLAERVRELDLPISRICQDALRQAAGQAVQSAGVQLGEILENQARWRETVAEDYPDDVRNTRAADALRGLAAYVRELPADDRRLLRIASAARGDDMRVAAAGEKWHEVVDRYGFHSQPWPSDGLDIVAAAVEHDAAARREDG